MTARKPKDQLQKRGRKSGFRSEFIRIAFIAAKYGAIEEEIARDLGVSPRTFANWKNSYPEFLQALKTAKEVCDDRMERSLFHRGIGYSHEAVKVFLNRDGKVIEHKYIEHYPPDTAAAFIWLKNRRPDRWRDTQQIDHAVGHYVISERPMTEEEWIRAHASNAADLDLLPAPKADDTK
jgi:hypothetical protein